jgi:alkylation response protein AidB-like acyl-CoA dehydrogenase
MDFSLTSEQLELRRMLRDVTADRAASARLRDVMATPSCEDSDLWRLLASDLGLLGVAVPEDLGGTGGSFVDSAVVIEESGRGLWPVPVAAALAAVSALSGDDVVTDLASGERRAVIVAGDHVVGAAGADLLVLAEPDRLRVVDSADATVSMRPGMDPLRPLSTVEVPSEAGRVVGDAAASRRAVDLLRVALAVEAVGVATWCLDTTVAYLKTREQFGRPIGSFQALAHRAADLAVELSAATSTAYYAAWVVDGAPEELAVVGPLAKAVCADAAYRIAAETIQLHGGIGFTWEHDAHLYFKRATASRLLLGDSHHQRQLVAARAELFSR